MMRSVLLLLVQLQCFSSVTSFTYNSSPRRRTPTFLRQAPASPDGSSATSTNLLIVKGQNIDLTPALIDHVNKRIGTTLNKLAGGNSGAVRECDVILSVSKNPKVKDGHRVEVVTNLKGTTIVCQYASPDMYNSIDAAAHALNRKLTKYKQRRTEGWHGGAGVGDDFLLAALEELEEELLQVPDTATTTKEEDAFFMTFEDPEKPTVTKVNSFDLKRPISVEEAVFALDYVDHDFYVFKNQDTDKISVVYKRHTGGIGLVEP